MFLKFSPLSFFFLYLYIIIIILMIFINSFLVTWIFMEISMFLFLGVVFSYTLNNFDCILIIFMIQSLASLGMFMFWVLNNNYLLMFLLMMKLGLFPFMYWFLNIMMKIDFFMFFMLSTFQKIPSFFLFDKFIFIDKDFIFSEFNFLILSMFLTMMVSSYYSIYISDARSVLIMSSFFNNIWFLLSILISLELFIIYLFIYSISLFFTLLFIKNNNIYKIKRNLFIIFFLSLSGLPPFPLFFLKLLILLNSVSFMNMFFMSFLMFFTLMFLYSQLKVLMSVIVNSYSNYLFLIVKFK